MKLDQKTFDKSVIHPVQSWAWGEFRKKQGSIVERFVVDQKGYLVLFSKLPLLNKTVGILTQSQPINKKVVDKLKNLGKKHNAIFIKVEPYQYEEIDANNNLPKYRKALVKLGLKKGKNLYPRYSFLIDLSKSTDELMGQMKSKTRYNVRLSKKRGVTTKMVSSDKDFEAYLTLLTETTNRQEFFAHTKNYQQNMWDVMKRAKIAKLMAARYDEDVLTTFVLFEFNERFYYPYGASTRKHKNLMAPQLTMWSVIEHGKQKGLTELELWGSLGKNPDKNDPWYGFHRFKEGFGGKHIEYVGAYDLIVSKGWYRLYCFADTLRWWWLKNVKKSNT
jgi:lipid II:glycine glycyltransferase (peptidoglycan interpeptide bridge formation enzyme)